MVAVVREQPATSGSSSRHGENRQAKEDEEKEKKIDRKICGR